jgi:hypothetical protein
VESYFDLAIDDGAPVHLTSACAWDPAPSGPTANLGPAPYQPKQRQLDVGACVSTAMGAEGIGINTQGSVVAGPATFGCEAAYTDPMGNTWASQLLDSGMCTLTVTKLGAVGESVEGTVSATVGQAMVGPAHKIDGSFHICRSPDAPGLADAGGACAASCVEVAVDDGPPIELTSICSGAWDPTGSLYAVGSLAPPFSPPHALDVTGCTSSGITGARLELLTASDVNGAGTVDALVKYDDAMGAHWWVTTYDDPKPTLTVTKLGAVGDFIDGTFSASNATAYQGGPAHSLTGSFHVCREPDDHP